MTKRKRRGDVVICRMAFADEPPWSAVLSRPKRRYPAVPATCPSRHWFQIKDAVWFLRVDFGYEPGPRVSIYHSVAATTGAFAKRYLRPTLRSLLA